jgi:alkyl sulfatase BDS1-like metallo-beta-lactamase superfamily hydrolase
MEARELLPRTFFVSIFSGVSAFETDEGLLLVDTGLPHLAPLVFAALRAKTQAPLHTVVFTHGHVDHAYGLQPWLDERKEKKELAEKPLRVIAHRGVSERFERYDRMRGLNQNINRVQFSLENVEWPTPPALPNVIYDERLEIEMGGETFELRHGRGETDDATWVWAPRRKTVVAGDFWINCAPNCGNPQKVQRYAEDWKGVLEAMAALKPELVLPGHGPALVGALDIQEMLGDAARYLGIIVDQTIDGLNAGLRHEDIVRAVKVPDELAAKPWLQPLYDRPEFIARNVIRLHGGWWDGFAANLLPSDPAARAKEIVALAGVDAVVARARALKEAGDLPLACHLAEWARLAEPTHRAVNELARDLFDARAEAESSLMARGIFNDAARAAEKALGADDNTGAPANRANASDKASG